MNALLYYNIYLFFYIFDLKFSLKKKIKLLQNKLAKLETFIIHNDRKFFFNKFITGHNIKKKKKITGFLFSTV